MAVINTADDLLTHPQSAGEVSGKRVVEVIKPIAIAAADSDTSQFLLAEIPGTAILESITLEAAAIAGATDYDVGIFDTAGAVIDADILAAALDMSDTTGLPVGPLGEAIRQAMTALALTDAGKQLFELAGHVSKTFPGSGETLAKAKYRIVLTANTIGTAAGDIVARIRYLVHY